MAKSTLAILAMLVCLATAEMWNVPATVALVKKYEPLSLTAYVSTGGVLTIGWGHTGADVYTGMTITQAQAETYLRADLQRFA